MFFSTPPQFKHPVPLSPFVVHWSALWWLSGDCEVISRLQALLSNSCNCLSYSISLLSHFNVAVALILTQKLSHSTPAFLVSQKRDEQLVSEVVVWAAAAVLPSDPWKTPLTPVSTKPTAGSTFAPVSSLNPVVPHRSFCLSSFTSRNLNQDKWLPAP